MINDNINILLVSEAKLDYRFPVGQFCIDGYSNPYRLDRTSHGVGILLYIREDIPSNMLKFEQLQSNFEGFFDEIILRKKNWLLSCLYYPNRKKYCKACEKYRIGLDQLNAMITYWQLMIVRDFNLEPEEEYMLELLNVCNLKNLLKQKTCYKNLTILHA